MMNINHPKKRYKAVIYDCDGVMFNSLEANRQFYRSVFNDMELSLDFNSTDVMRIIHTYSNIDVLRYFFPDKNQFEKALQIAGSIDYLKLIHLMIIENDLTETLELLKTRVHLAVCTNRSSSMDAVLSEFKLNDYFDCVMTASKASFPKPHPDPLLRILTHFSLNRDEAVFVGDSEIDSVAAKSAGVDFISYKADFPGIGRMDCHKEIFNFLDGEFF